MAAEYYHASRKPLEIGTALECRFRSQEFDYLYLAVYSALKDGLATLKALMLDDYLRRRGKGSTLAMPLREIIFEGEREANFPHLPSRWGSIFLCKTLHDIQRFASLVEDRPHIYACTLDGEELFSGDISHLTSRQPLAPIDKQLDELRNLAKRYWNGDLDDNPLIEVLARPGTVTIAAPASV